jgi:hypothetical protein
MAGDKMGEVGGGGPDSRTGEHGVEFFSREEGEIGLGSDASACHLWVIFIMQ